MPFSYHKASIPLRFIIRVGLLTALSLIIAQLFHLCGLGKAFSPLHLPAMLGGFCFGPYIGLAVGLLSPLLSSVLTGMPALVPNAVRFCLEIGCLGFICGWLSCKQKPLPSPVVILIAQILSRCVMAGADTFLFIYLGQPPLPFWGNLLASLSSSFPGIILQLILLPPIIKRLRTALADK